MHSYFRFLCVVAVATAAVPVTAHAQDSTVAQRRAAALVLDHTFSAPVNEPVRVFLAKGIDYRAYITNAGKITLAVKPMEGSVMPPRVMPLLSGTSAAGDAIYTITPKEDAIYVFTTVGGDPANPVNLRLVAIPPKKSGTVGELVKKP